MEPLSDAGVRRVVRAGLALAALCGLSMPIAAQSLAARASVSAAETEVGVPFNLQVRVEGSDAAPEVDLPPLDGVAVRPLSAGPNNSESITIVNGRTTRRVERSYILNYELVPSRPGRLEIPAIGLTVIGRRLSTQPLAVTVFEPQSIDEYRLLVRTSADRAWVGQPITVTTTWMWQEGLGPRRLLSFSHPVMHSADFDVEIRPAQGETVELTVHGTDLMAARGSLRLGGAAYQALVFELTAVPRAPGRLQVPAATVAFEGVASFRTARDRFGRTIRDVRRLVIASEPQELQVEPLPAAGRPDHFSGLVGSFEVAAVAAPTNPKVGDPISLQVTVRGSGDLAGLAEVDLTRLDQAGDFRVGAQRVERSSGRFPSRAVFRATIRALRDSVSAVPPVRLSYFDPQRGAYAEASSAPIALDVQPARQVTLRDVEGGDPPSAEGGGLAAAADGIAHNYEGDHLLRRQRFDAAAFAGSPAGVALLAAGPAAAGIVALWRRLRRIAAAAPAARGALARLRRSVAEAGDDPAALAPALHGYLHARIDAAGAAGPAGWERALRERGAAPELVEELQDILERLDAARYGAAPAEALGARIRQWAEAVDAVLSRGGGS